LLIYELETHRAYLTIVDGHEIFCPTPESAGPVNRAGADAGKKGGLISGDP